MPAICDSRSILRLAPGLFFLGLFTSSLPAQWVPQTSGATARFRGLCVVNAKVVWASGTGGTFARTSDGGKTWRTGTVPGASALDFRDIHAFDDRRAVLLSIGEGGLSRIYRSDDGGTTWSNQFTSKNPKIFLDALAFWDDKHGIALGDPIDGRFLVLTTDDGGVHWKNSGATMPAALAGEGAFAASGTCVVVQGSRDAWFGTGGAKVARVFHSTDRGESWKVHDTPITAGNPSSGIFSLAFRGEAEGVAVGGDYKREDRAIGNVARTSDGGQTWTASAGEGPHGYRSAVTFVPGAPAPTLVAVGPTGSDLSLDGGATWSALGKMGFHAAGFAGPIDAGWGVGDNGRIARFHGSLPARRP